MWSFSWLGQKVKDRRLLALLNCSERAEFEDDYAVSLAVAFPNHCILLCIPKMAIVTTRHSDASEARQKQCI